jgi:hypothetical protein
MTKEQRLRIIFWGVIGFLGLIRTAYCLINGNTYGLVFGLLWVALGFGKAWSEAKRVDEAVLGQPELKQPDRPGKSDRR